MSEGRDWTRQGQETGPALTDDELRAMAETLSAAGKILAARALVELVEARAKLGALGPAVPAPARSKAAPLPRCPECGARLYGPGLERDEPLESIACGEPHEVRWEDGARALVGPGGDVVFEAPAVTPGA